MTAVARVVDPSIVAWNTGQFVTVLAGVMLIPLAYAAAADAPDGQPFALAALVTGVTGGLLLGFAHRRPIRELKLREGMLLVVLIWLTVCGFGALPLYFSPHFPSFTDALFESTSGFTTTGATVLADLEAVSRPVHLWRCLTHWLGGMGIVLLGIAILPIVGQGGTWLYRAEFSGASAQRIKPRVMETAKALWKIYLALTLLELIALRLAGMDTFEATCHAFSTLATGGFSTRTESIAGFHSPLIEYIVIVFMILAGMSFIQHYRLFVERRPDAPWQDFEVRSYLAILAVATVLITVVLITQEHIGWRDWEPALRDALFQVASILTTTGFITADYELWHPLSQLVLLVLMIVGGCTGSTAGGLKVARIVLLTRVIDREFRKMSEPHGVFGLRLAGQVPPDAAIAGLLNLFHLAWLTVLMASLLVAVSGVEVYTSIAAVIACMFNVGPGLGEVGPMDNFGHLPVLAKWVLAVCMIAGRLEFYTLLVILTSAFWRR